MNNLLHDGVATASSWAGELAIAHDWVAKLQKVTQILDTFNKIVSPLLSITSGLTNTVSERVMFAAGMGSHGARVVVEKVGAAKKWVGDEASAAWTGTKTIGIKNWQPGFYSRDVDVELCDVGHWLVLWR